MTEQEIDWGELGRDWWFENGKICGATDAQIRFSAIFHGGASATAAARASGYSGSADGIRQSGHRAAHSVAVMALLNLAHAQTGTGPSGNVDIDEAKGILSRLARQGGDPNTRLRACETLVRIHEREEERQREHGTEIDIRSELADIAKISPDLAKAYAAEKGVSWKSGTDNE